MSTDSQEEFKLEPITYHPEPFVTIAIDSTARTIPSIWYLGDIANPKDLDPIDWVLFSVYNPTPLFWRQLDTLQKSSLMSLAFDAFQHPNKYNMHSIKCLEAGGGINKLYITGPSTSPCIGYAMPGTPHPSTPINTSRPKKKRSRVRASR